MGLKGRQLIEFCSSRRGLASVEFGLIAPVVITFMLGSFVLFDSMRAARALGGATSVVADLATRLNEVDDVRRDAIFQAADAVLGRFGDGTSMALTMTSVVNPLGDGTDDLVVAWSQADGAATPLTTTDLTGYSLPTIPDGESVVLVSARIAFNPVFSVQGISPPINLRDVSVRRPRFVTEVCYRTAAATTLCGNP